VCCGICDFWLSFVLCIGLIFSICCVAACVICGCLIVWVCFVFLFWGLGGLSVGTSLVCVFALFVGWWSLVYWLWVFDGGGCCFSNVG